jgi:site-specific DNA recombinase
VCKGAKGRLDPLDMLDLERAPLVRRAFEEFATGRFTKREVLATVTRLGLRNRRGAVVSAQTFDSMLENGLYAGIVDVPEYGVRDVRGDFNR